MKIHSGLYIYIVEHNGMLSGIFWSIKNEIQSVCQQMFISYNMEVLYFVIWNGMEREWMRNREITLMPEGHEYTNFIWGGVEMKDRGRSSLNMVSYMYRFTAALVKQHCLFHRNICHFH